MEWLYKYLYRNPYTGAPRVDLNALESSPELAQMLSLVWEQGYSCGFRDGDGDSYIETQAENPYKTLKKK